MHYQEVYELLLDHLQKVMVPEDMMAIGMSLSRFELVTLLLVDRHQPVTMGKLAQCLGTPLSTATGLADRLVKKELLARSRSEEDRRVVVVSLAEEGKRIVGVMQGHFRSGVERVERMLGENDFMQGMELLRKVLMGLQAEAGAASREQAAPPVRRKIPLE